MNLKNIKKAYLGDMLIKVTEKTDTKIANIIKHLKSCGFNYFCDSPIDEYPMFRLCDKSLLIRKAKIDKILHNKYIDYVEKWGEILQYSGDFEIVRVIKDNIEEYMKK